MAKKNQNTFEKRRRDMEKKLRAEEKRRKRQKRNSATELDVPPTVDQSAPDDSTTAN